MNLLVDELPSQLEVDGKSYDIRSDFRTCLRIILAFEDPELSAVEKSTVLLKNLYIEMPDNLDEAVNQGVIFLNGGDIFYAIDDNDSMRLYSFTKDSPLVLSAFKQTHNIDLEREDMHWWKFLALFMDLGGNTTFSNLVGLRKRVRTGKATKEEREVARELGAIMDVPDIDNRTLEEREIEEKFFKRVKNAKND
jgi:hypothetical protein